MSKSKERNRQEQTVEMVLSRINRPKSAVVTAGMPYANGPLHIGHLAGAQIPADIYARWLRMLIGKENVLFVCGTDDHGSTSEVSAIQTGVSIRDFIDNVHKKQEKTLKSYSISLDIYTGTSRDETFEDHCKLSQEMFTKIYNNQMLEKKISTQWYDTKLERFLPDRYVTGTCPNESCNSDLAYSNDCDECGAQYESDRLKNPKSTLSGSVPVLKETTHWFLNMWKVTDVMKEWVESKKKFWRKGVFNEVYNTILPSIIFSNQFEPTFKEIRADLPKHKSRYAPGKKIVVQFESLCDIDIGQTMLGKRGVSSELLDGWAHRSITRDVAWGIPLPVELDPDMANKTLYVWPDSLIAPISFSKIALKKRGVEDPDRYKEFWTDPDSRIYQFLGQDNVFFYVIMQAAMWLGSQANPLKMPGAKDLNLTDVFSCFHLQINNQKMSKSTGNFYTGDQLLEEMGYHPDQIRYFLALLSLPDKRSNLDFNTLNERNKFLAGPLNAAIEKPISACHSKFEGVIPEGKLLPKAQQETIKIVGRYTRSMERGEFSTLLFAVENYARLINSFFTQFKPHDDRFDVEKRKDALYSSFCILKNLMIMLYPFVPSTMERVRVSLNLPDSVFSVDQLGVPIEIGHQIGEQGEYFPGTG